MKRCFLKSLLPVIISLILLGCSGEIANPTPGIPNDNGQNNNGNEQENDTSDYGEQVFLNSDRANWVLEGAARITGGNIEADNFTAEYVTGSCTLLDSIDFQGAVEMYFTWRDEISGDAEYTFFVGTLPDNWVEIYPQKDNADRMYSRFEVLMGWNIPIHCRFEFNLPPETRIRIKELRAFCKL